MARKAGRHEPIVGRQQGRQAREGEGPLPISHAAAKRRRQWGER